jgi:hypothetical protein
MPHITTLRIYFGLAPDQGISDALAGLPKYCAESFREHSKGCWSGEFQITCPVAPNLADGDFEDDLAPYFPQLLRLKRRYNAAFELQIAVGAPAPEVFILKSNMVALLASLGAEVEILANQSSPVST